MAAGLRKKNILDLQRPGLATARALPKAPLALVLDNVRSGLNTGSAFRTADGFALAKIHLCGITAQPPHREIHKTALGATETVAWEYWPQASAAVKSLQEEGWQVWAVEQAQGSCSLENFVWDSSRPLALVFGNEVMGVGEEVMALVDGAIEVPQFGAKHSFNIAVCIGVVVWEVFRQWKFAGPPSTPS